MSEQRRVQIKTAFAFEEWATREGQPGQRICYHHGHLALDRLAQTKDGRRIDLLADLAHRLGEIDHLEYRKCGHPLSVRPAAHKVRLLAQKDPEVDGAWSYFAELLPGGR